MKRLLLTLLFALSLAWVSVASADEPAARVYVVDVQGEGLDADRVRTGIARELGVVAVAPEDPRAATAVGHVDIDARSPQKSLRVTFRKVDAPVTRVVGLPADATKAESTAVLLAGNLARDEASELLQGMRKPAPPPRPAPPSVEQQHDAEALERMRAILADRSETRKKQRIWGSAATIAVGLGASAPGVYLVAKDDSSTSRRYGGLLVVCGTSFAIPAFVGLFITSEEEDLYRRLKEIEADTSDPGVITVRMDEEWKTHAEASEGRRRFAGTLGIVIGSLALGGGTALAVAGPSDAPWISGLFLGIGALDVLAGTYSLLTESPLEDSYRTWKLVGARKTPSALQVVRPTVGVAPLPGGAAFSAGFSF